MPLGLIYAGVTAASVLYTVSGYWRGLSWARMVVLVVSFAIVVGSVSSTLELGGSFVTLMSHPAQFLRFAMAAFLLWWLNTRPLRAWFKNAGSAAELIGDHLTGKLCTAVEQRGDGHWQIAFEHETELTLYCPWRIVLDDNLAFASNAAVENYSGAGLGAELIFDEQTPRRLLQNLRVHGVRVAPKAADLFLTFEMGIELQTWNGDSQKQQWEFSDSAVTVIADSTGIRSRVVAAKVSTEDSAAND